MPTPPFYPTTTYTQGWAPSAFDQRSFGTMVSRILDDLNRPDLQSQAVIFAQDAVRHYRANPFFFSLRDNLQTSTDGNNWVASFQWPLGACIDQVVSGIRYAFVVVVAGTSGTTQPVWPSTIAQPPSLGQVLDAVSSGCVADGTVVWANAGLWAGNAQGSGYNQAALSVIWTQLCTVPQIARYTLPLDFMEPQSFYVVYNGTRVKLDWLDFENIQQMDNIRPASPMTFPTAWCIQGQQLVIWPYPAGFYPLELYYNGADLPPQAMSDVNRWTTTAEPLIRAYTRGLINAEVLRDNEAASNDFSLADQRFLNLMSLKAQRAPEGIPPETW